MQSAPGRGAWSLFVCVCFSAAGPGLLLAWGREGNGAHCCWVHNKHYGCCLVHSGKDEAKTPQRAEFIKGPTTPRLRARAGRGGCPIEVQFEIQSRCLVTLRYLWLRLAVNGCWKRSPTGGVLQGQCVPFHTRHSSWCFHADFTQKHATPDARNAVECMM